jgi:hypothetical protein
MCWTFASVESFRFRHDKDKNKTKALNECLVRNLNVLTEAAFMYPRPGLGMHNPGLS